ncbi:MAG: polysaccharide deacetylase family protein [Spirochaetales bacterium]
MKKSLLFGILLSFVGWILWGEVSFSTLHLSSENLLLFQATAERPGENSYSTLFLSDLSSGSLKQLTFFPEEIQFLEQTGQLQIQNRFGVFRTTKDLFSFQAVDKFPSFSSEGSFTLGKLYPLQSSPDGRYLIFQEPSSAAYGKLILYDLTEEKREVVSDKHELTLKGPLVQFSPDSKYFIYSKEGKLYYFSIEQYQRNRLPAESLRVLGTGSIQSVQWGPLGDLYYVEGTLLYRILGAELFARSLYQPLLRIGRIIGKLPLSFDPNFDLFWVSSQGDRLLLAVGGRNLFIYPVGLDDFQGVSHPLQFPYLNLPRTFRIKSVIWSKENIITLLTEGILEGKEVTTLYRIDLNAEKPFFTLEKEEGVKAINLSRDQRKIALLKETSISIRNYGTFLEDHSIPFPTPLHFVWLEPNIFIVAGMWETVLFDLGQNLKRTLSFSQPDQFGFQEGLIVLQRGNTRLGYNPKTQAWKPQETFSPSPAATGNESFRVFLEPMPSGPFKNLIMVRNLKRPGTYPLFTPKVEPYEPLPEKDEIIDFTNFTHGSRVRGRYVSFVFNAVDSVEGLSEILNTLAAYNIRATFFVNGDFIRRNPGATKELAYSGHEIGSLFYTYFNITDPQFRVTSQFIKQGLARNEDEYYQTTGKELTLLWHTPYYFLRDDIVKAAQEMNYTFIGRDVDSLDWAVKRTDAGKNPLYYSSADLIERILRLKKPGSVISFQVGRPEDGQIGNWRDDYLFQRLDLLINRLIEKGYQIVPVSVLMDLSR